MTDATQIKEHAEIVGSDGAHVGTVDHMDGSDRIKLVLPQIWGKKSGFSQPSIHRQFGCNFCSNKLIFVCFMIRRPREREANQSLPVHTFVVSETSAD